MDYESRQVKWYWLLLFMLYCGGVVYLLFQGNPFLYSRQELRSSMDVSEVVRHFTIPLHPIPAEIGGSTYQARYNMQRTAVDPAAFPRSKNFEEFAHDTADLPQDTSLQNITQDAGGFYLSGKGPWVTALGLDGKVRWRYRFKEAINETLVSPVLLDEASAYFVSPQGEVVCVDKATGEIRWLMPLKSDVVATPLLWKKSLLVPTLAAAGGVQMTTLDRASGQVAEESPHLDIKPGFELSEAPELKAFIATIDNKVLAINSEDWQVSWSQIVTDPIKGPAVAVGEQIFVATLAAKVVKLSGAKKGKLEWEADIVKPPASAPTFLPIVNRISILDTSGALSLIDSKSGKVYWRMPTENRNPLTSTWSARLKGKHIEEFKMDWLNKGWTTWTPCYDNSFCIFTPKGILVTRVHMSGRPLNLPLPLARRLVFLVQSKPGHYILSQVVEDAEIKELKAKEASENH